MNREPPTASQLQNTEEKLMVKKRNLLAALVCIGLTANAVKADDIVDTAVKAGKFNTLVAAVKAAGLVDTLKGKGPFTVFAPTDEAFGAIPKEALGGLLKPEAKGTLTGILTYHVVAGNVSANTAYGLNSATTVNGQRLNISRKGGRLVINDATVVITDIKCDNGTIHVIDKVLMPATDGLPGVATKAGTFNTLLAAAKAAGLVDALAGKGPLTVFAPTDDAFRKLPEGTVASLLKPENKGQLAAILKYHVVSGRVFSDTAVAAGTAKTLQGQAISVRVTGDGIKINDSKVVAADIQATNGVIHVIDSVLMPKKMTAFNTRMLLERTVAKGSRAFNHGNVRQCCKVYEQMCEKIVADADGLPEMVPVVLKASLKQARRVHDHTRRAWVLRDGIDVAYRSLH